MACYKDPNGHTVWVPDCRKLPPEYKPLKEAPKPPAKPKE